MKESKFQKELIDDLKNMFPGCMVLKNDPAYIQGVPDLLILYKDKWAALEVKNDIHAAHQPNQDYYVNLMNEMSFASFVFPQNREEVLHELQSTF